ncbi:hypothetical protein, partial [Parabacteroides leei]
MAEYSREQRNHLSRAITNGDTGSRQLKGFVDNRCMTQKVDNQLKIIQKIIKREKEHQIKISNNSQYIKQLKEIQSNHMYSTKSYNRIIQKREPEKITPLFSSLTHGSIAPEFLSQKDNPSSGIKNTPDSPAWFGIEDPFISILATLRNFKKNGSFPVYSYFLKENLTLA